MVEDHLGNTFRTIKEMCAHWGVSQSTYAARLEKGMSMKKALTEGPQSVAARRRPLYLLAGDVTEAFAKEAMEGSLQIEKAKEESALEAVQLETVCESTDLASKRVIHADGRNVVYLSDLHFDNTALGVAGAEQHALRFIACLRENYFKDIVLLGGDFFSDQEQSLWFVKEVEKAGITGFFVLGNHEFRSRGQRTLDETIDYFMRETEKHRHFRMLVSGVRRRIGSTVFIGDTGWTSFEHPEETLSPDRALRKLDISDFAKNVTVEEVLSKHNKWVNYANKVLAEGKPCIVLTHFPMYAVSQTRRKSKSGCCMWSSKTAIAEVDNAWFVYGHTHELSTQYGAHVCSQLAPAKRVKNPRFDGKFGVLSPTLNEWGLVRMDEKKLVERCYAGIGVSSHGTGYRRVGANMGVVSELACDREYFISEVRSRIAANERQERGGYVRIGKEPYGTAECGRAALSIVSDPDYFTRGDIRAFVVAIIVCGYFYHGMDDFLSEARLVDDADIVRLALVLFTRLKFNIPADFHGSVSANKQRGYIRVCGEQVYLPTIDGKTLTLDDLEGFAGTRKMLKAAQGVAIVKTGQKKKKDIDESKIIELIEAGAGYEEVADLCTKRNYEKLFMRILSQKEPLEVLLKRFEGATVNELNRLADVLDLRLRFKDALLPSGAVDYVRFRLESLEETREKWRATSFEVWDEESRWVVAALEYTGGKCDLGVFYFKWHRFPLEPSAQLWRDYGGRSKKEIPYESLNSWQKKMVDSNCLLHRRVAAGFGFGLDRLASDECRLVALEARFLLGEATERKLLEERDLFNGQADGFRYKIQKKAFWNENCIVEQLGEQDCRVEWTGGNTYDSVFVFWALQGSLLREQVHPVAIYWEDCTARESESYNPFSHNGCVEVCTYEGDVVFYVYEKRAPDLCAFLRSAHDGLARVEYESFDTVHQVMMVRVNIVKR